MNLTVFFPLGIRYETVEEWVADRQLPTTQNPAPELSRYCDEITTIGPDRNPRWIYQRGDFGGAQ